MKLTFCNYDSPSIHGGPMSWLKRFLPALRDLGYEIEIIFFIEGDIKQCKFLQFFKENGFVTYIYSYTSFSYFKIRFILDVLSKNQTDIFVPNAFAHAFYASKWLKPAGIPTLGILHSDDEYHHGEIEEFINGREAFRLSAVVAVSELLRKKVAQLNIPNLQLKCIPYGAPTDIHKDLTNLEENGKTKLVYLGRLSQWQKKIKETTHALCKAAKEIEGIEVMFYGGGEVNLVKEIIKSYGVEDKVKLGGLLPPNEVQDALINHDVFVLLSDFEGIPIALMEAMACGLVPVCTKIESGVPELVLQNQTGFLVNNREDDFIEKIRLLHTDKDLLKKLSINARNLILKDYSSEKSVLLWDGFLKEIYEKKDTNPKKIKVPFLFFLPPINEKLLREDFRILDVKRNFRKHIYFPLRSFLGMNVKRLIFLVNKN